MADHLHPDSIEIACLGVKLRKPEQCGARRVNVLRLFRMQSLLRKLPEQRRVTDIIDCLPEGLILNGFNRLKGPRVDPVERTEIAAASDTGDQQRLDELKIQLEEIVAEYEALKQQIE